MTEEGFPGALAVLPVVGTLCCIGPVNGSSNLAERILAWPPLVQVGRMSYSLYLWHWPVFSLVDYHLYLEPFWMRTAIKVALSAGGALLCHEWIENPGRSFLNAPRHRRMTFAFLGGALAFIVPLGIAVRNANYVDAPRGEVARGGLLFNASGQRGAMVLMGDSNGSMYGKMAKEMAEELDLKLNVLSVAADDPLPQASGEEPKLWQESRAVVQQLRPDFLLLVCHWQGKLQGDETRLRLALGELSQHARRVILITQPPALPRLANRASMREGSRPPFFEEPRERDLRVKSNALVKRLAAGHVTVVDVERLFVAEGGSVRFADVGGNRLYYDSSHLSGFGADLVKAEVLRLIRGCLRSEREF